MEEKKQEKQPLILLAKLQKMRVELLKCDLKMTGKNTFSKYDYFQLSDFMPDIMRIMLSNNVVSVNEINDKEASLTLINLDNTDDKLKFTLPLADAAVKGASSIQQVGAQSTYYRRYLYMIAFEISEADLQDEIGAPEANKQQQEDHPDLTVPAGDIEIKAVRRMLEETGVPEKAILDRYKVEKMEDLTKEQAFKAMKGLEETKKKIGKK